MNKSIAIMIAVMISSATAISGCSYTSKTDSKSASDSSASQVSSTEEEKIDTDSSNDLSNQTDSSKSESNNVKNNEETAKDSNTKIETKKPQDSESKSKTEDTAKPSTKSEDSANTNKSEDTANTKKDVGKATTYTAKAGYTLTFPASWEGKYVIEDKNDVLIVRYKCSKDKNSANAWLFSIEKAEAAEDLDAFDTIGNIRTFNVKDSKYYVGGPTGLTLGENSEDFKDYLEINRQCAEVVNSIKVIK